MDTEDKAQKMRDECGISFAVGYGLDAREVSRLTGCFYEIKREIVHATGFVLKPDGTIAVAVYSTGPIGRLVWQDVLGLVNFYKKAAS